VRTLPVLALVLFVLWGLLVQGTRGLVQHRRTGDSGFRRDLGRARSVSWWAWAGSPSGSPR
jgi:hypothetical protein